MIYSLITYYYVFSVYTSYFIIIYTLIYLYNFILKVRFEKMIIIIDALRLAYFISAKVRILFDILNLNIFKINR
jgi:hypothetical protein